MAVFPIFYAGNISYFQELAAVKLGVIFETKEFFPKQTYRNRLEILGPNGHQKLVIPTEKTGERRRMEDVRICYAENWQKIHWKSLEAAYRRSPYFEYYEHRLQPFYKRKDFVLLSVFNLEMQQLLLELLGLECQYEKTLQYEESYDLDFRNHDFSSLKLNTTTYLQVFSDRHPFHGNLSILDALFNLGPEAKKLLLTE
jgi:hypothetical protein